MDYYNLCIGCFSYKKNKNHCPYCNYEGQKVAEASLYLPPRTILAEKYLIGKVLGQGGFGITYLGWDMNLDIKLAIKEFFPQGLVSRLPGQCKVITLYSKEKSQFDYGLECFIKEAKTLAHFEEHPNIVNVRDFFKANNTAYMVMSFIEGITLLEHLNCSGGRISVEQAVQIIMPVLDALKEVHQGGILHRDISPDNIHINKNGRVILIDFGAARQEMRQKSKSLSVILKAGYAPEEQYRSRGKQGPWSDIYAVGATLYRALTGQVPLEAMDRLIEDSLKPPSQLGVDIESDKEKILLRAMAVKASDRFQQVGDLQDALLRGEEKVVSSQKDLSFVTLSRKSDRHSNSVLNKKDNELPFNSAFISKFVADYYIDYKNGTIPLSKLDIGVKVVDPSWGWEFRTGKNYTRNEDDAKKPVTWILVARNHYNILDPHVTLLAEELIGKYPFDFRKIWFGLVKGKNHWGDSGTANAERGLRPWLGSSGIHEGEGFYAAFSDSFKSTVLRTPVPNREWKNGSTYSTQDKVFIPSANELGDTSYKQTYWIGTNYPYFKEADNQKRVALLGGEAKWYWTRTPVYFYCRVVLGVAPEGEFYYSETPSTFADSSFRGVRPALNLKADTLVSEINP